MGKPLQAHVMAAKAAVDQISNAVAIEYGPYGVTSNVVTPGPIAGTEGMQRLAQSADAEGRQKMTKRIPVGRWGEVKEIADATVFLFSEGGSYINGHVLVVDGGQWRVAGPSDSDSWAYPDFLLSGKVVDGVKTGKKAKL
nr:peroxisomal 2,4-dienoyl-coa reductase sps19 [Quercus suber]